MGIKVLAGIAENGTSVPAIGVNQCCHPGRREAPMRLPPHPNLTVRLFWLKKNSQVYQRPRDPERPLVCLDETSKQLIVETRAPIPAKPGQPARHE